MNLELALLPLLTETDSLGKIWEGGVRPVHIVDLNVQEVYLFSVDYYMASNFTQAPSKEVLEEKFGHWFSQEDRWTEKPILAEWLIDELLTRYKKNKAGDVLIESARAIQDDPDKAIETSLGELYRLKIDTTPRQRVEDYAESFSLRQSGYVDSILEEMGSHHREPGIPLGWGPITDHTFGIRAGEIGIVAGYTGTGKSWTAFKMALTAALSGKKVYLASLELSKKDTLERIDCLLSGVSYEKFLRGTLTSPEIDLLKASQEKAESIRGFLNVDTPTRRNERSVLEFYSRAKSWGADLVIGDQLSWVTPLKTYNSPNYETLQMSEVIYDITDINKEMEMASLWMCQFNRESVQGKKSKGGLNHIALSSKIEQNVDLAFGIATSDELKANESIVIDLLKCRKASTCSWLMNWEFQRQTNLDVLRVWQG